MAVMTLIKTVKRLTAVHHEAHQNLQSNTKYTRLAALALIKIDQGLVAGAHQRQLRQKHQKEQQS